MKTFLEFLVMIMLTTYTVAIVLIVVALGVLIYKFIKDE